MTLRLVLAQRWVTVADSGQTLKLNFLIAFVTFCATNYDLMTQCYVVHIQAIQTVGFSAL